MYSSNVLDKDVVGTLYDVRRVDEKLVCVGGESGNKNVPDADFHEEAGMKWGPSAHPFFHLVDNRAEGVLGGCLWANGHS